MAKLGASSDPQWIANEIYALEKTLAMYKVYTANAPKADKVAWNERVHTMEERIEEAHKKLEKATATRR